MANLLLANRLVMTMVLMGVLTACSGGSAPKEMYRKDAIQTAPTAPKTTKPEKPKVDPQRMAAIKAFGLDEAMHPKKLVGLDSLDVSRVLGKPHFVRRDKGVEIWQYRHEDCILDLFLYEKERTGLHVDHSELRGPRLNDSTPLSCFSKIVMGKT